MYDIDHKSVRLPQLLQQVWNNHEVGAVVAFTGEVTEALHSGKVCERSLMVHSCGNSNADFLRPYDVSHSYAVSSPNFVLPGHNQYDASAAGLAHTRSLAFLKKHLGGPNFDLEAIWDEHTLLEFGERSVEKTMGTMVEEPYVNHIPTV